MAGESPLPGAIRGSHEVLREAIENVGVKSIAHHLRLSPALVYKWCEQSDSAEAGGASKNPLDRVAEIVRLTGDMRVVNWLCNRFGGHYVSDAIPDSSRDLPLDLLDVTQKLVLHFSDVLSTVSRSISNDGFISPDEAKQIRAEWEGLKGHLEQFVQACERGHFQAPKA